MKFYTAIALFGATTAIKLREEGDDTADADAFFDAATEFLGEMGVPEFTEEEFATELVEAAGDDYDLTLDEAADYIVEEFLGGDEGAKEELKGKLEEKFGKFDKNDSGSLDLLDFYGEEDAEDFKRRHPECSGSEEESYGEEDLELAQEEETDGDDGPGDKCKGHKSDISESEDDEETYGEEDDLLKLAQEEEGEESEEGPHGKGGEGKKEKPAKSDDEESYGDEEESFDEDKSDDDEEDSDDKEGSGPEEEGLEEAGPKDDGEKTADEEEVELELAQYGSEDEDFEGEDSDDWSTDGSEDGSSDSGDEEFADFGELKEYAKEMLGLSELDSDEFIGYLEEAAGSDGELEAEEAVAYMEDMGIEGIDAEKLKEDLGHMDKDGSGALSRKDFEGEKTETEGEDTE